MVNPWGQDGITHKTSQTGFHNNLGAWLEIASGMRPTALYYQGTVRLLFIYFLRRNLFRPFASTRPRAILRRACVRFVRVLLRWEPVLTFANASPLTSTYDTHPSTPKSSSNSPLASHWRSFWETTSWRRYLTYQASPASRLYTRTTSRTKVIRRGSVSLHPREYQAIAPSSYTFTVFASHLQPSLIPRTDPHNRMG